jgi:hypothetical protein
MFTCDTYGIAVTLDARYGEMGSELQQAVDGSRPEHRCVASNCRFSRLFDTWQSPVQGCDQFLDLTREFARAHRHVCTRFGAGCRRRAAFHTSPQPAHRQYVFSSACRPVVVIARD